MNPFLTSPQERMVLWRDLRTSLADCSTELEQLEIVNKWWNQAPIVTYTLDYDQPDTWPSPWEVLFQNTFCETAKAYMMEQTLLLSPHEVWTHDRLNLIMVKDLKKEDMFMAVLVDNKYLLNYYFDTVVEWDTVKNDCVLLAKYKPTSKGHMSVE